MNPFRSVFFGLACAGSLAAQSAPYNVSLLANTMGNKLVFAAVWGYTAPDGREFAIVGEQNGTWILDCTNPGAPVEIATIPGPASNWREMTSYGSTIYSGSEHHGGVRVIDMSNPTNPVDKGYVHANDWPNSHTLSVDPGTGRLYVNGTNLGHFVCDAAADLLNLPILGVNLLAYVHDCYVRGGRAYLAEIANGRLRIADPSAFPFQTYSTVTTPGVFTHSAWATDDPQLCLTTDENNTGYLQAWDTKNPNAPAARASYVLPGHIVHNVYGIGRTAFLACYTDGFHVVDVGNAATAIKRLAHYDTSTIGSGFAGAWGCYPWTESGVVYVSDMQRGLFVLRVERGMLNRHGQGVSGPLGVPRASFEGGSAMVDSPKFRLELTNLVPSAPFALVVGDAQTNLPLLNVTLYVDPTNAVAVHGTADAQGRATVAVPIPNDPGLTQGRVHAQVFCANGALLAASRGMWFGIAP